MGGEEGEGKITFHTSQEGSKTPLKGNWLLKAFSEKNKWIIIIRRRKSGKVDEILWVERSAFQL